MQRPVLTEAMPQPLNIIIRILPLLDFCTFMSVVGHLRSHIKEEHFTKSPILTEHEVRSPFRNDENSVPVGEVTEWGISSHELSALPSDLTPSSSFPAFLDVTTNPE